MTKIKNLISGLTILAEYSNEVTCDHRTIFAGPIGMDKISKDHYKELLAMDWDFELGEGWSFLL
jgi:hypothetical protein